MMHLSFITAWINYGCKWQSQGDFTQTEKRKTNIKFEADFRNVSDRIHVQQNNKTHSGISNCIPTLPPSWHNLMQPMQWLHYRILLQLNVAISGMLFDAFIRQISRTNRTLFLRRYVYQEQINLPDFWFFFWIVTDFILKPVANRNNFINIKSKMRGNIFMRAAQRQTYFFYFVFIENRFPPFWWSYCMLQKPFKLTASSSSPFDRNWSMLYRQCIQRE